MSVQTSLPARTQILSVLRGQRVRIPNLGALVDGWPNPVNPDQEVVTSVVQHVLETYSMTNAVEMKLKRANLSFLIASWYPFASAQRLKEITYFVCWMYMFDDAIIDKVSWPGLDNVAAFDAAYQDLIAFVRNVLRLDGGDKDERQTVPSDIPAIDSFRGTGEVMRESYSLSQRQSFYDMCKLTMEGYRTEQQLRVAGQIPTWEEYWTYREGSSCMGMCVAMIEFAIESNIPEGIMQSLEMRQLWTETTVICWLMNDMISAKKELGEGFIENAVALGAIDTNSAQDGMNRTFGLVKDAISRFEEKADMVKEKFCTEGETNDGALNGKKKTEKASGNRVHQEVGDFIKSCQCIVTGALSWRLVPIYPYLPTLMNE